MYPDPDMGEYDINGERFTLMDGIVGLAHSPAQGLLYYQPLATDSIGYYYDSEKLQFCAEVRWAERDNGAVWALSTRFHKYFRRQVNKHEIHIRVVRVVEGGYPALAPHVLRRAARRSHVGAANVTMGS
ncbi:hypothetical protein MSG28_004116 [Choristoneura fumiferana]|uniref:Uncharacterized protein n=1 Tax=Choristoneura fumiferana TaxID=7141 RepID=A0ACC0KI79_CHOFU|nr:hypothetical protein MSG28_004116 [Choristoneura fumiferana]